MLYFVIAEKVSGRLELRRDEHGVEVFLTEYRAKLVQQRLDARRGCMAKKNALRNVKVYTFVNKVECEGFIAERNSALKGTK